MSLWSKSVESITFDDVNNFLFIKEREGPWLDYKADVPKDLPNLLAAFANTNGGLIILGVDADKTVNEPKWPRSATDPGMRSAKGIEERIHQICRDNIYPPVRPQVSSPIDIPGHPDHVLVVVRIDMSPEAPHATDGGRKIYERSGSVKEPFNFAHIDRIQHLLDRRRRLDEAREESIRLAIDRAVHQMGHRRLLRIRPDAATRPDDEGYWMMLPFRWTSVIPYYPWSEICSPEDCLNWHRLWSNGRQVQGAPGGSFAFEPLPTGDRQASGRSQLTTKGHVFSIESTHESLLNYESSGSFWVGFGDLLEQLRRVVSGAQQFYGRRTELPGSLLVSVGFMDVRYYRMYRDKYPNDPSHSEDLFRGWRFPDATFRADQLTTARELIDSGRTVMRGLMNQVAHGFDLPSLPLGDGW